MRLLFDQNLSPRLKEALRDLYPESLHVRDVGLESADDVSVWEYANQHGLMIASKDSDFRQLSFTLGHPPKVIWIRCGNCSTSGVELVLRSRHSDLLSFDRDAEGAFIVT